MQIYVYSDHAQPLASPVTGQYIVDLQLGDVVEMVVQNLAGNASGMYEICSPTPFACNATFQIALIAHKCQAVLNPQIS